MRLESIIRSTAPVIREARYHIYLAIVFFIAGAFIGYHRPDPFVTSFDYLSGLARYLENRHLLFIVMVIFIKNVLASFIAVWSGTLLGIIPLFAAAQNGVLLGAVFVWKKSVVAILLNILPHGIFELPAFLIACGLGIWRGTWVFRINREETYKERARRSYGVFFRFVLPLLLIAATIEGFRIAQIR